MPKKSGSRKHNVKKEHATPAHGAHHPASANETVTVKIEHHEPTHHTHTTTHRSSDHTTTHRTVHKTSKSKPKKARLKKHIRHLKRKTHKKIKISPYHKKYKNNQIVTHVPPGYEKFVQIVEEEPNDKTESASKALPNKILESILLLEKAQTNLSEKFNNLATQITALLGLFEIAAKSFTSNPQNQVAEVDQDFMNKINQLIEQNKILAKGLTMVEERMREGLVPAGSQHNEEGYHGPGFKPMIREINPQIETDEKISPPLTENKEVEDSGSEYEPSINQPLPKF